jgi:hypothetical protein
MKDSKFISNLYAALDKNNEPVSIADNINDLVEGVGEFFSDTWNGITDGVDAVGDWVGGIIDSVKDGGENLMD